MPDPRLSPIPELLAPAGGVQALRAAIANGADAVYLGIDRLNARRSAENFTLDSLPAACDFAHLRGRGVYLTANVLILPHEMSEALDVVDRAWAAGVDAVIVQDLGLLREVRQQLPHVRVHASTQMNVHSADSVEVLGSRGVSRVTLARETSLAEIGALARAGAALGVEVESFVHGALCMCYSGQCLLSSLIGGRSANRGRCAQPCRMAYELADASGAVRSTPGAHLLSPKDLAGIGQIPALVESGVAALKIEGRMKSPEYVALVTGVYRSALDRYAAAPEAFGVRDGEQAVLSEAFSRGFTEGYLVGDRGNEMMSYGRPNNRGVPLGRVVTHREGMATVSLDAALDAADTIEVWTSRGRFAQTAGEILVDGRPHRTAPAGVKVVLSFEEPAGAGDRVFRVRNATLSDAAARTFADEFASAPLSLEFTVKMTIGAPLSVLVRDADGHTGAASGPVVEAARTRAVTVDEVMEHVGRLGNTPYLAAAWNIDLSAGAGIGFSALHRVRRDALAAYEEAVLAPWRSRRPLGVSPTTLGGHRGAQAAPRLVAGVANLEAAEIALGSGADEADVPTADLPDTPLPAAVVPVFSRVLHDADLARDRRAHRGAVAGTLGELRRLADAGAAPVAHWSLNAANAHAVAELADLGATAVWLSPELSARQIEDVSRHAPVPVGTAVYGRQEVMVTEHCVLMAEGECSGNCGSCGRRRSTRVLVDRKGYRFPVVSDVMGRSHIYNSVPLDLTAALAEVIATGVGMLRLDLETESCDQVAREVERVRSALNAAVAGRPPRAKSAQPTTTGHFFRGVE